MTLYEINKEILNCVTVEGGTTVNMETGEVVDPKKLDGLKMAKSEKIKNIALWIKNLRADAAALKAEKEAFASRQKAAEAKEKQLTQYLESVLNGETVKDVEFSISYRKSQAVELVEPSDIPSGYLIEQPPKVDKAAIRDALKHGCDVPGAELVTRQNIQIK